MQYLDFNHVDCELCQAGNIDIIAITTTDITVYVDSCPLCEGKGYLNQLKTRKVNNDSKRT